MISLLSLAVPLLLKIFQYLNLNDKKSLSLCCAYLQKIISHPLQWSEARIVKKKTPEKRVRFLEISVNSKVIFPI